jgi:putative transposase
VYPILYIDGIRIRVKDNGVVTTKVAYLAIGVDVEGRKHALGCWIADAEGAKFWQKVLTDLRNRGVRDVLIACCDGLTGLPDAIGAVFPDTVVQTAGRTADATTTSPAAADSPRAAHPAAHRPP